MSVALAGNAAPDRHGKGAAESRPAPEARLAATLPARGLPLGLRLGLSVATTVVLVLGGVTALQQRREITRERHDREVLLAESLAPLAAEVEAAASLDEVRNQLASFQRAYVWRGYPDHQVALMDGSGRVVTASVAGVAVAPPESALRASVAVQSTLLPGGIGQLEVWQDASVFVAESAARWRLWWFTIALTAVIIVAMLQVAIFLLVSRPLGLLVRSLRRMEMGYLGPIEVPRGAWELRWVVSRLERTAVELQQTVRRMVAAERRALQQRRAIPDLAEVFTRGDGWIAEPPPDDAPNPRDVLVRQYLEDTCRLLSSLDLADPLARSLAQEAWDRTVLEAEQAGAMDLKAEIEDSALRILEPEAFSRLHRRLAANAASRRAWLDEQRSRVVRALAEAELPHLEIQQRVKHTAGVWRKMLEKQLELDQVHDLYALRVIVPDEEQCYIALHAVHGAFEPEPFRFKDYISSPKANGYRSLHTTVRDEEGRALEIQIRSLAMHRAAERGSAAHWLYKAESADATPAPRSLSGRLGRLVSLPRRPSRLRGQSTERS
jgi:ppGpp synthetase/RelA/SpoT-type nucleotidyltranferase